MTLRDDELERSSTVTYEHLGQPVNEYVPSFERERVVADWRARAACKGMLHIFYGPNAERPQARIRRENAAKEIREICPVKKQCLDYAITNVEYGYWAGTDEYDRGRISGEYPKSSTIRPERKAV